MIAGVSQDCDTESRTAASRTFCFGTEVLPLLFSQVCLSIFPLDKPCCCLPACLLAELVEMNLEEAFQALRSYFGTRQYLSPFDRAQCIRGGKLSVLFCSRDLQQGSSFSRESPHSSNIIFKITMVKIFLFLLLCEGSHRH